MMSWIGLHKFASVISGIIQKLLCITPSNLVRWYITNKEIFVNFFRSLNNDRPLVPGLLFLITLSFKETGFEEKIKLMFLKVFDNPASKYLVLQEFIACNGCFELFTKIKKESGTSFWSTFSAWFFHKNVPYYSINGQSFNAIPFFLLKISNKMFF